MEPIGQHFVKFWHQPAKFETQIRRPFATNTWGKGIVLPCYYLKKPINWGNQHTGNLPAQLLVKKTQTFQSHQDFQEVVREEDSFFQIYAAL
jgi:hypothetical protein